MRRVFSAGKYFRIPDGTRVAPLLNPFDALSGLPPNLFESFSVALGTLAPGSRSSIHLMPYVTQVTVVLTGTLTVKMKGSADAAPYRLHLRSRQAALTLAGTLLQLINHGRQACTVLYIVSPSYVFDYQEGRVRYDDAITLNESWAGLERLGWRPRARLPTRRARAQAIARLRQKPMAKRTP